MIGRTFGHYQIATELGVGGMGTVYRADDLRLQRPVAIKFVSPHLCRDPEAHQRLLREARSASALDHPHIGVVHEVAETDDGQLYIVMALYEGGTLRQRLDQGPLPIDDALRLGRQITEGLAAAHAAGIVHRDLKPENILLTRDGQVRIVDFGLAKSQGQTRMTRTGSAAGTVAYMSPEQARGDEVDARTDLFSLGVILYEMLGGRPPFRGDSDSAVLYQVVHEEPPALEGLRAEVPQSLRQLVARLLAKDPAGRYPDAAAVLADLGSGRVRRRWPRRRVLLAATGAIAILGLTTWWAWPRYLSETARFKREIVRLQNDKRPLVIAVAPFAATGGVAEQQAAQLGGACVQELNRLFASDNQIKVVLGDAQRVVGSELEAEELAKHARADAVLWGEIVAFGDTLDFQPHLFTMPRVMLNGPWVMNMGASEHSRAPSEMGVRVMAADTKSLGALIAAGYFAQRGDAARAHGLLRSVNAGDLWVQSRKAWALVWLGDVDEAALCSEALVRQYPESASAHEVRGAALYNLGHIAEALLEYKKVQQLNPANLEMHNRIGWAYRRLGQDVESRASFQRAADMSTDPTRAGLWTRGEALAQLGRYEEAALCFQRATRLAPHYVGPRAKLAEIYYDLGRYEEALAQIEIVRMMSPRASSYAGVKVRILLADGRVEEANECLATNRSLFRGGGSDDYFRMLRRIAMLRRDYPVATEAACSLTDASPRLYYATMKWLVACGNRGEFAARGELERDLAARPPVAEDGFFEFVQFLLAGGDDSRLLELVADDDEVRQRQRQCEYFYYLGMRHLIASERGEGDPLAERQLAVVYFQRCMETGVRAYDEYVDARLELRRLQGKRLK